jgi:hypothetical protein
VTFQAVQVGIVYNTVGLVAFDAVVIDKVQRERLEASLTIESTEVEMRVAIVNKSGTNAVIQTFQSQLIFYFMQKEII